MTDHGHEERGAIGLLAADEGPHPGRDAGGRRRTPRREAFPDDPPRRRDRAARAGAEWRRTRRMIALGLVLVVSAVTLGSALRQDRPVAVDLSVAGPEPASQLVPAPPPRPLKLASRGPVLVYLPINRSRVTAIVYHRVDGTDTLSLEPAGKLLNAGIVDQIEQQVIGGSPTGPDHYIAEGSTASVDVGAAAGTQVYAPVNGRVVGITPMILDGEAWGSYVAIEPQADPGVTVVLSHVYPDPALRVGSELAVSGEPTLIGTVADLSEVLEMELAKFTSDEGNHVHIEVRPAPVYAIP